MLETIDARTDLARPTSALREWTYRRNPRQGVETWTAPETPDGLSLVSVTKTPDGYRLRAEGNLITALYGPQAAAGTLTREEVPEAVSALLGLVEDTIGQAVADPEGWDVHRLDPSRTVRLPPGVTAAEVVTAALAAWSVLPSRNVSLHKRETCTRAITKWRSHSIYDKTADLRHKGQAAPHGLLRLEARLRPRAAKAAAYKDFRPTLALTSDHLETAMRELDLLASSVNSIAATSDLMLTRALIKAGCPHSEAVRVCTTTRLVSTFGVSVLQELGVPTRTAERWVAEIRKWQSQLEPSDLAQEGTPALEAWSTLLARDVAGAAVRGPARKARSAGTGTGRETGPDTYQEA